MVNRKNVAVVFVFVLLLGLLAGCAAQPVQLPEREVPVSMEEAMAAQEAGMAGLATGSATFTEAQLSSFLTEMIKQNAGGAVPVEGVTTWFNDDGSIAMRIYLTEGTIPGINTVDLVGTLMVEDGRVKVDLAAAGAGPISVTGPMLDLVEGMINRALDDPSLGVAVAVEVGDGVLTISLGQ